MDQSSLSRRSNECKTVYPSLKMRKTIGVVSAVLCLLPGLAHANGWSESGFVTNLQVEDGTYVMGSISGADLQCGNGHFVFAADVPKEAHLFSLMLTAQVEGASVKLWQIGCEDGGTGTVINGARIE